ncbi:MAG: hypothetical protein ACJAVY_001331 [Marinoscillum sp.]|jgi:hypothetical protein
MNINPCNECNGPIPRRENHTNSDYNRKKTCSKFCANQQQRKTKQLERLSPPVYELTPMDCFILGKQKLLNSGLWKYQVQEVIEPTGGKAAMWQRLENIKNNQETRT